MKINKDELKEKLTIEQVFDFVQYLGGEPIMMDNFFVSKTICHNRPGEGSYKLYYYNNTHLFKCYTHCDDTFDIYSLLQKVKQNKDEKWNLIQAIEFVATYFGYIDSSSSFIEENKEEELLDWKFLKQYSKIKEKKQKQIVELKVFDDKILLHFPQLHILPWEQEGISYEAMQKRGIRYNPINHSILIPHYNENNNLIGIRERTLIKENEIYGKYKPAILAGEMYNHPLSFNLYNLNNSKDNIRKIKKAIVFEGEKSCIKYASYFGEQNDISVAACGSSLISYQVNLLLKLGVEEIIIGFDRQYKEIGDEEYQKWIKKLKKISSKYCSYCNISFLFDTKKAIGYKEAPIDQGPFVFMNLFNNRLNEQGYKN